MKTYILSIALGALLLLSSSITLPSHTSNDALFTTVSATFDGYEGGYYIFTDENEKAVTIYTENEDPIGDFDLKSAHHIGSPFKIKAKTDDDGNISPLLTIEDVVDLDMNKP
jgi:hypothetical protein